jgi:hypothetical protein
MPSTTVDAFPVERDVRWPGCAVGPNAEETAEAAGKAIIMVKGSRGSEGQPGVIGDLFPQAAAAVVGLPDELRPGMAATEEAVVYLNTQRMACGADPSGEMVRASKWGMAAMSSDGGGWQPFGHPATRPCAELWR